MSVKKIIDPDTSVFLFMNVGALFVIAADWDDVKRFLFTGRAYGKIYRLYELDQLVRMNG